FIYSGQFDRETLDALYNLIVDGDDGRDVPRHYWTLVEIGRAPATPPEIIRRMVLETPPKFLTEALTAAAYNPHAAIIPPESFIRHLFLTAPDELIVKCLEAFARFAP